MEIIGRLLILTSLIQSVLEPELQRQGLSLGGFDVLASLRRQGHPYELSPTELYQELLITSGTMTSRLNNLEKRGLIARRSHPGDRRSVVVSLTKSGKTMVDDLLNKRLALEQQIVGTLSSDDQRRLGQLLRKWILTFKS